MRPSYSPCPSPSFREYARGAWSWWPDGRGGLLDAGDLDDRQLLPVALTLVVPGLVLELVDPDLGALGLLDDLAGDRDLGQRVGIGGDGGTVDHEDRGQRHGAAGLALDLLDLDVVPLGDLLLLCAGLVDRVPRGLPLASRLCGPPGVATPGVRCSSLLAASRRPRSAGSGDRRRSGPRSCATRQRRGERPFKVTVLRHCRSNRTDRR